MSGQFGRQFRGRAPLLAVACFAAAFSLSGCADWKQLVGMDQPVPDEFAVESRAPLTIPPDFNLRPPKPGAPRPQEVSASERVQQVIDTAGPGAAGDQASSALLPESLGTSADPNRTLPPDSLASKLLGSNDTAGGSTIDRRETDPLKGVY